MAEASGVDVTKMSVDELKEECRKLNLKISGNKAALQQRVRAALEWRSKGGTPNDSEDDGEDDEELHDCEHEQEDPDIKPTVINQPLTFKHVEDSQTRDGRCL